MGQIPLRDELLDELTPELALHERVGRNHAHETRRFRAVARRLAGEIEEALRERNRERVPEMAGPEAIAIRLILRFVFRRDVWRIADYNVVDAAEDRP